jgi:hypothetical protein
MKKYLWLVVLGFIGLMGSGCGTLMSTLGGPESPRPKEYQVSTVGDMVNKNVPVVMGAQTNKQDNIKELASVAVQAIGGSTTRDQAEAISSISANAFGAIQNADGSAGIIGKIMNKSSDEIMNMSMSEYAIYAATQGVVASRNQQTAYQRIKLGWEWTSGKLAGAAAAALAALGRR